MRYSIVKDHEERWKGAPPDQVNKEIQWDVLATILCNADLDGDFVLHWHREECWRIDFEIAERGRNRTSEVGLLAVVRELERDLLVMCSLSRELDFEVGVNGGGVGG